MDAELGKKLAPWTVVPFATLLLAIAILPLITPDWWKKNRHKALVSFVCVLPVMIFFLTHDAQPLLHEAKEYLSFILLLATLYILSGGIYLKGELAGTPIMNTTFLALGAVLGNLIGTTGASMLLIRPLLRANEKRQHKAHIVIFFIFLVSNIGGLLTPLGDPPLFLGFLRGVPFEWTIQLFPMWALMTGILLVIFHFYDDYRFEKGELGAPIEIQEVQPKEPLRLRGALNLALLLLLLTCSFLSGKLHWQWGAREAIMALLMFGSWRFTPHACREGNRFTWAPIIEVAVLFAGIFTTMIPALLILNAHGGELGLTKPWEFFWVSGSLSSFLDNAPTYLSMTSLACGVAHVDAAQLGNLLAQPSGVALLKAISCGAVFMGANTYIGNGPNFMVRAMAEETGVKMPSFFGYMAWAGIVLLPLFALCTFVFFW